MRRAPVVIGVTAAGLAAVLSFHAQGGTRSLVATSLAKPGGTKTGTTSTTGGAKKSAGHNATPSSAGTPTAPATSATGVPEQYGYGVLSTRVTVRRSKITDVQITDLQTADSYSQQIANQVIPYLRREVLASQTSQINGISGATYTGEAYVASVQSALDKLHWHA